MVVYTWNLPIQEVDGRSEVQDHPRLQFVQVAQATRYGDHLKGVAYLQSQSYTKTLFPADSGGEGGGVCLT